MPEIKHTFTGAKMNKDIDERLIPNGEYRDAMNVQVRTTDADSSGLGASGVIQNLEGNEAFEDNVYGSDGVRCVASIADEKNDKAYFLFGSIYNVDQVNEITEETTIIDSIIEQDVNTGLMSPVLIDKYAIINTTANVMGSSPTWPNTDGTTAWTQITVASNTGSNYRAGMTIKILGASDVILLSNLLIQSVSGDVITIQNQQTANISSATGFIFEAPRVLNFNSNIKITGINIIDNLLFWTDNYTEPKKINIDRCKAGCTDFETHTELMVKNPSNSEQIVGIQDVSNTAFNKHIKEEHITVIKKAPLTPPSIHLQERTINTLNIQIQFAFAYLYDDDNDLVLESTFTTPIGDTIITTGDDWEGANLLPGDTINFVLTTDEDIEAKLTFNNYEDSDGNTVEYPTTTINATILSYEGGIESTAIDTTTSDLPYWDITIDMKDKKPLFELKFPRFGYRYKYEDGEYSSFSPWSDIAFIPGPFDYSPKKGYNLAMANTISQLTIKDFIPFYTDRLEDIASVDILYKTTDSPNVYTIKTVERKRDSEWELFSSSAFNANNIGTGELLITSEMIHSTLPSNQILRAWDNVPRKALAQEIVGNRLVYGNYLQGFNMKNPVNLIQNIYSNEIASVISPKKSIKSIRDYKLGIVFGDKYGRETPVIPSVHTVGSNADYTSLTGDIVVEKTLCALANSFTVRPTWDSPLVSNGIPENWMEYIKYYVKETSSEYYNLVMDRWYRAEEEENVWLSFPSADRNKVDEETYLILKNEHGNQLPVLEKARYKIIAIENEAPDFIKKDYRTLGRVLIDEVDLFTSGSGTPENDQPTALVYNKKVTIIPSNWGGFLDDYIEKGKLTLRFIAEDIATDGTTISATIGGEDDFVTLNHWNDDDSNFILHWEKAFGNDGDLRQRIINAQGGSYTFNDLRYYVEIREEVVENKPEFDGRFFVLIEKDDIINETIEKVSGLQANWVETGNYQIAYIDSQKTHPQTTGLYSNGYDWGDTTPTGWSSTVFDADDADYFALGSVGDNGTVDGYTILNYANETKNYWEEYYTAMKVEDDDVGNGGMVFMDGARAVKYQMNEGAPVNGVFSGNFWGSDNQVELDDLNVDSMSNTNYWATNYYIDPDGNEEMHSMWNFKPSVFSGLQTNGTHTEMTLSQQTRSHEVVNDGNWEGVYGALNAALKNGTYFKFDNDNTNDGEAYIYKVVGIIADSNATGGQGMDGRIRNYQCQGELQDANCPWDSETYAAITLNTESLNEEDDGVLATVHIGKSPGDASQDSFGLSNCEVNSAGGYLTGTSYCQRVMMRIKFLRVNEAGQLSDKGIDLSQFDPRGQVAHDGTTSLGFRTLDAVTSSGSIIVPEKDRAVWETEPKESTDLDIYYEASHALPIKLKKGNTLSYIPITSEIGTKRLSTNNAIESVNITASNNGYDDEQYTDHKITGLNYFNDGPVVRIKSTNIDTEVEDDHILNMGVGDFITFTHNNGMETKSKIIGYYNNTVPQTPYTRTITLADDTISPPVVTINDINFIGTGMNVVGIGDDADVVPSGIFTFNYSGEPDELQLSINPNTWMTIGQSYDVEITMPTGYYLIDPDVYKYEVKLGWFNCWAFGNGVESDRIRDDFNAPQLDNGVKVSTTFTDYKEETKGSGMIYSGLYNSISSTNNLNEFNMAEKITKDLNPAYGSIQAFKTRDTDVIVLAEDKVLRVLANKDAIYNADGNMQLTATDKVLGTAIPFVGDYGISKNPESLAWDQFRIYFTDSQRGAALRLSRDGLTPISNVGMNNWFKDNLKNKTSITGTFDKVNGEYNITIDPPPVDENETELPTISFNEAGKGWVSFKSFALDSGVSISGKYLTTKNNKIYQHYSENVDRNIFYDATDPAESTVTVMFNDQPSAVKSFKAINYEGTQAKIDQFATVNQDGTDYTDGEYYNIFPSKLGWYVSTFSTDLQDGKVNEFINKENKWFNRIQGITTTLNNLDTQEFTVQGIGVPNADPVITPDTPVIPAGEDGPTEQYTFTIQNDPNS